MKTTRGALIVLEGCDRSGKTTQSKRLVEHLVANNIPSQYINFPCRDTPTGHIINDYLKSTKELDDQVIHLLFTANRWEAKNNMKALIDKGITLVVDRYSYSGVAFSAAKGMDVNWCKGPEKGLLRPDLVILLTLQTEAIMRRGGFGNERYEIPELQSRVMNTFNRFKENDEANWVEIDADSSIDELNSKLVPIVLKTISGIQNTKISKLWEKDLS